MPGETAAPTGEDAPPSSFQYRLISRVGFATQIAAVVGPNQMFQYHQKLRFP